MQLHHVGIEVGDVNESSDLYRSTFGARLVHRAKKEKDGIEAAFLKVGDSELELMAPLREDSPVGKFVARRGPGVHHVAFGVADIEQAIANARAEGLELIDTEHRIGMNGSRIALVNHTSMG